MVRTIIQLSEEQSKALKQRAKEQGVSVSELARRGVDMVLASRIGDAEVRKRAMAAVGFISDVPDLSVEHDKYISESHEEGQAN